MINSKDISVVVQGAVDKLSTPLCLKSIRKYLPDAQIILSTWEGTEVDGLDYDELVLSKDPCGFPCDEIEDSLPNNINRQLVSTQSALKICGRKYCLKLRSDLILTSDKFLVYFGQKHKRDNKYAFTKDFVLVCSEYSRNPRYKFNVFRMPYCVSDFFYFGFTEDIKNIFDINLVEGDYEKKYFSINPDKRKERIYPHSLCRYMPEQYIWLGFVKKYLKNTYCEHRDDCNRKAISLSEKTIANNCVILNKESLSIVSGKEYLFTKGQPENCYDERDWKLLNSNNIFFRLIYLLKISLTNIQNGKNKRQKPTCHKIHSFKEINIKKIKQKYISFDIFDTLLYRKINYENIADDRTALYASMLSGQTNYKSIIDSKYRYIEKNCLIAKEMNLDAEYDLYDCYNTISKDANTAKLIVENEIARDIDILYVNKAVLPLLEKLKSEGKTIIAISDMFYSKNDIVQILQHFDLLKYFDKVYVSSDVKYMKYTGRLFKYVLNDLSINPSELVHIGDNRVSDVLMPDMFGIKTFLYKDIPYKRRKSKSQKQYNYDKQNFVKNIFNKKTGKTFLGYIRKYIAPDIINFVYSMIIDAYQNKIENIFFLERDGNIFYDIWQVLIKNVTLFKNLPKINLKTIKLSRKDTACLINLNDPFNTIIRANKVNSSVKFSIKSLIGNFGLTEADFTQNEIDTIINNDSSLSFYVNNYNKVFLPKLKKRQEYVAKKLEAEGLWTKKTAICDIGWGGTSQKDMMEYIENNNLGLNLKGYYYATDDRIDGIKEHIFSYQHASNLWHGYSLLEFLIKAYKADNNKIMQETYRLNKISREEITNVAEDFSKRINETLLLPNDIAYYTNPLISFFIKFPPYKFAKLITNVYYSLDRRINDEYIPLVPKIRKRKEYKKFLANAQYANGSLSLAKFTNINTIQNLEIKILKLLPYYFVNKYIKHINDKMYKENFK